MDKLPCQLTKKHCLCNDCSCAVSAPNDPIESITLRLLVKEFLDRSGRIVKKFKDNLPGRDFVYGFLQRHRDELAIRMCQNIKRSRAGITPNIINGYFDELTKELEGVPVENIVNYDETNLTDDPLLGPLSLNPL